MRRTRQSGQAIVMVTLALVAMFGMIGLAIDVGWSFYIRRTAQAAADAAALAAAKAAYAALGGQTGSFNCSNANLSCQVTPTPCSGISGGNLNNGCLYAQQNGFTAAGNQNVLMQANTTTPYVRQTGGSVPVSYWVTARVNERIPQLFSRLLGGAEATTSARATAAVVDMIVDGAIILLNRQNDRARFGTSDVYGLNLKVQANDNQGKHALQTAGNIYMASNCHGVSSGPTNCKEGNKAAYAGSNQGGGTVYTLPAKTGIRSDGWYELGGSSKWISAPTNNAPGTFDDPMSGKSQPPPPTPGHNHEWLNGEIVGSNDPSNPLLLAPGNHYAVDAAGNATGNGLQIKGYVRFGDGGSGFGGHVFYGGVSGANNTTAYFSPGRYVFAGAKAASSGPGSVLKVTQGFSLLDNTSGTGANSDAGELFIMTDPTYPGLQVPSKVATYQAGASGNDRLQFGTSEFRTGADGANNNTQINLHGLNPDASQIQTANLDTYAPTLFWQDRRNSFVAHNSDGTVDISCGGLDAPCTNTLTKPDSAGLVIQASPNIHLYGVIYQPRGAWTTLVGGGGYTGPLQLITGALNILGSANINLTAPTNPLTIRLVSLIE